MMNAHEFCMKCGVTALLAALSLSPAGHLLCDKCKIDHSPDKHEESPEFMDIYSSSSAMSSTLSATMASGIYIKINADGKNNPPEPIL